MRDQTGRIDTSKRQALGKMIGIGAAWTAADALLPPNTAAAQNAPAHVGGRGGVYNVKLFGATGGGKTLDTPAINKAIEAAAAAGGGTVLVPAGTYLCFSIRLKSNVALYLDQGSTILGATPPEGGGPGYDPPEPGPGNHYEDFGHRHWHNALIWGVGLENISILGPGLIYGKGLLRGTGIGMHPMGSTLYPIRYSIGRPMRHPFHRMQRVPIAGQGDKCIALKNCHNVILRDFSILHGGHFGILATGVDNMTIDNLLIDTERDGMDLDCCWNTRVTNCTVNDPYDDGICPKSSDALGYARPTKNLTVSNCFVTGGYEVGSVFDGTWKVLPPNARRMFHGQLPPVSGNGRFKCGTESFGGFENITLSNCVFEYTTGLALETVDGAHLEDVSISNVTMRNVGVAPIFMRLGSRMFAPDYQKHSPPSTPVGTLRRVNISNLVVSNTAGRFASILSGIPGHDIEDVRLSGIYILHQGGGTKADAAIVIPEKENGYPEPTMFGTTPSYGFFLRHIKGLEMSDIEIKYEKEDERPPFMVEDAKGADFFHVNAQHASGVPVFALHNVEDFSVHLSKSVPDTRLETVKSKTL
jgi:polygalacturonase